MKDWEDFIITRSNDKVNYETELTDENESYENAE